MSCPRYMLTLSVCGSPSFDMNISTKLKTRLGDIDGLEEELLTFLGRGDIRRIVEMLHEKHGGCEEMSKKWSEDYTKYLYMGYGEH